MDSATPIAGWTGGPVSRTRQTIIGDGDSENFRCNVVNFHEGATTARWLWVNARCANTVGSNSTIMFSHW